MAGFFVPIRALGSEILALQGSWQIFWMLFYAFATYGFAGHMREQVCKYMCPYARFQSAMFDKDTLIVTYDTQRGDPLLARLNVKDFPIRLTSNGAITQRWLMLFTSGNQFELYGEQLLRVLQNEVNEKSPQVSDLSYAKYH